MGSAGGGIRHEAGWVAVHRDGDPCHVLVTAGGLDRFKVGRKAVPLSSHLPIELSAWGCRAIPADALHVPSSAPIPFSRVRYGSR